MRSCMRVVIGFSVCMVLALEVLGQADDAVFFRIVSPANSQITSFNPDGTLVWTNAATEGVMCTVQRTTAVSGGFTNWVDYAQCEVTNVTMALRVYDPQAPAMVLIPAGTNSGANPLADGESYESYYPENYSLTVDSFYMDKYEVTNDDMVRVMQWAYNQGKVQVRSYSVWWENARGSTFKFLELDDSDCRITWNGSFFEMKDTKSAGYPCVEVTWFGAVAYCNYRSEMEGRTPCYDLSDWSCGFSANGYRLPTNDEWEYAARGGLSGKRFPWGDTINHNYANYRAFGSLYTYDTTHYTTFTFHPDYDDGGYPYTSPAGAFAANGYGLYDMSGNVREWCNDAKGSGFSPLDRAILGGHFASSAAEMRCGEQIWIYRHHSHYMQGFRAVCR